MIRKFRSQSNRTHGHSLTLQRCATFLLGCILTSCSPPGKRQPFPPHGHEAELIPATAHILLSDGTAAPIRIWRTTKPRRALVLALHGFGDSRDAWEFSAPQMAEAGIETVAPDLRGFGETCSRGQWSSTARMVQDAREEAQWATRRYPDTPLFVIGESMGGAIATLMTRDPPAGPATDRVKGFILVSPAIWRLDPFSRLVLDWLDILAPNWTFTGAHVPGEHIASNNAAALRRLYFDPLTLHSYRLDSLRGLVLLMAAGRDAAPQIKRPVLIIYGDRDQMIPAEEMAHFWRAMPSHIRRDLVPGGHHLLLRDRNGRNATGDIISWILSPNQLLPSGGDGAAAAWAAGDPAHDKS